MEPLKKSISFFQQTAMKQLFLTILSLFLISLCLHAQGNQDLRLAQQYYGKGEYEKASVLFKKLYEAQPNNNYYYKNYLKTLTALDNFDEAEKLVKKFMKKSKGQEASAMVDMGFIYRQQERDEEAEAQFQKALKSAPKERNGIKNLANTFNGIEEYDYAIALYEQGKKELKDPNAFSYELALAYKRKGDFPEMITAYLDYATLEPSRIQTVKNAFMPLIKDEANQDELQAQLYKRIQNEPAQTVYPEMLTWYFITQKDYESAFIQVKALDKRLDEDGSRVFNLARSATREEQFDAAIGAYEYVVSKGEDNSYFMPAKVELLKVRKRKITETPDYTAEDLDGLKSDYSDFIDIYGKSPRTASSIRELAQLNALYFHDLDTAILLLEEVLEMPAVDKAEMAHCKLDLGDYFLMDNEVWESTLLYSQVDKAFKEDILGEVARFKNAKLSYYRGDFTWSQSQLDVLKASTSELIANDALELSVFITDNLGLDTITTPMEMYARADLLKFQNRIPDALSTLDSIDRKFPGHALADDILHTRAHIKMQQRDYEAAIPYFEEILLKFSDDLLFDDSLFHLGTIYQFHVKDDEKAKAYYEQLILEQTGSLYTVEARKRFRALRGDQLE